MHSTLQIDKKHGWLSLKLVGICEKLAEMQNYSRIEIMNLSSSKFWDKFCDTSFTMSSLHRLLHTDHIQTCSKCYNDLLIDLLFSVSYCLSVIHSFVRKLLSRLELTTSFSLHHPLFFSLFACCNSRAQSFWHCDFVPESWRCFTCGWDDDLAATVFSCVS